MKKTSGLLLLGLMIQGCASLMTAEDIAKLEQETTPVPVATVQPEVPKAAEAATNVEEESEEPITKYSDISNMAPPSDRQYKRMTRKKMEEESELYSSAGSLWKMEGQTSYLFAENKHRREGDPTSIKMEGAALKMIENKVAVISDLLKQLDAQRLQAEEDAKHAEAEKMRLAQEEEEKKLRAERIAKGELVVDPMEEEQFQEKAKADAKAATEARKPAAVSSNKNDKEERFDLKEVELIPSKIVEKMSDDTYRIRGQQYLTIKKKPYKVIATALIRAEDFNDNGVSSNKLLDAQYDVIHVKRASE
ncbi:flagellar basal body L-ring protein FlgH [bacterium]|nr:flagellar basal body L-ring protein FlgH [bacterium]